jgi:hypothetical protein
LSAQVVPLTNAPNQTFNVTLTIDSTLVQVSCTLNYNEMAGYWLLSVYDASLNALIVNVPCLTGVYPAANMFVQQQYLNIGSWQWINVSGVSQDYPDNTTLGSAFILVVDDTPEVVT